MKEFLDYFSVGLPSYVLFSSVGLTIVVVCVASLLVRNKRTIVLSALLAEYAFIVICSTVIFRGINTYKFERIQLTPFWTYRAVLDHTSGVSVWDIVLNVVLFLPLGLLVKLQQPSVSAFKVFGIALLFSIFIEANQYIFQKGVMQIDDVMHNVLGALIGWGMASLTLKLAKRKAGQKNKVQIGLMGNTTSCLQHFILTRFNLLIFNKDKEGNKVRTASWLEHRFELFEKYCLPSLKNQTCHDFEWIVLFDNSTPERFKGKIEEYKQVCPQIIPVYVCPEGGKYFVQIFRDEVVKRLHLVQEFKCSSSSNRVLTTYLDNDDALDVRFVEDIQKRSESLPDGSFIYYTQGYQFYTDHKYLMRVNYPRNHFVSVIENGNPLTVKTIYGYGSHYYIDKIKSAHIEYIKNQPMWCEVIHERNMGNDAYFLRAKMMKDESLLLTAYGIQEKVNSGLSLYLFRFIPRYIRTFIRRVGYFFFGRHW